MNLLQSFWRRFENQTIVIISVILAFLLRLSRWQNSTSDMKYYSKWYDFIVQNGGFSAFKYDFANYNPPYLYLMVIASYIYSSLPKILAIKLITILFDFLCAFFVYKLVRLKYSRGKLPIIAALAVLFSPTVFLNSSYWGQTDMLYTFWLVACLYYLAIERNILGLICFGIAVSFKQQAMFFAPFLIMLGVKKYISWSSLLIVPLVYFISLVPSWMAGRSINSLLSIYLNQAGTFKYLTLNAPNLYLWISNQFYSRVVPLGSLLTVTVIVYLVYIIYKSHLKITTPVMIQLALISVLVVPYVLPKMHERYFFAADVISIIFGFYYPRYFFVPIIINLVSLFSYFPYLMRQHGVGVEIVSLPILSLILGLTILITLYHLHQTLQEAEQQKLL